MTRLDHSTPTYEPPINCLYRGLAIDPDAIAAEDHQRKITYRQLTARVEALANGLRQQLPDGSPIALCARNHIDHLTAFLAILAAGFVWVPLNPRNGSQLNQQLLHTADPALILVDQYSRGAIAGYADRIHFLNGDGEPAIEPLIQQFLDAPFIPSRPSSDTTMAIKFTGGTSGKPKGVIQTHSNVATVVANMQDCFEFNRRDRNLAVAPLTHGGSHYILPILAAGGRHILLPHADTQNIMTAFKQRRCSVSFMPPTLIYKLLDQPGISKEDFPDLRHLTYSAAPMPPERITQVLALLGPRLSTLYGQTEAPMTITAMSAEDMQNPARHTSVGKACKHTEIRIVNSDGKTLPAHKTGEVAVSGGIVMKGYLQNTEQTAQALQHSPGLDKTWLRTGDVGYLDQDGYLFLQGRNSDLIISGGFNVYPAEVENALMTLPGVKECIVFACQDDYWGERVEAAVCMDSSNSKKTCTDQLLQQIKSLLGPVKTPKHIHLLDALPRNPVGKVTRREVRDMIQQQKTNPSNEHT